MDQGTIQTLFALLRSAIGGEEMTEEAKTHTREKLPELMRIAKKHDVAHLLVLALKNNSLMPSDASETEKIMLRAVYRYERLNYEYVQLCQALETAEIDFIPLKGSVLRKYYPQAWMRTSCDVDILVRREDLDRAVKCLVQNLQYVEKEHASHDVSLYTPMNNHIELHFDLVEEGHANNAIEILCGVFDNVLPHEDKKHWYDMPDEFFYFYHIAHMAKHFEIGGCGIRPFIDLWILDRLEDAHHGKRDELLEAGGLLKFANAARKLSRVWFDGEDADTISLKMEAFILSGGVYGTYDNRIAVQQQKKGGKLGYIMSRIFMPYSMLKRYYPILEKHRWLAPIMQIRRWFRLFRPDVARRSKNEIAANANVDASRAEEMNVFLDNIGLK